MNINSRNIYITYLFLYFSLLVGFYFNEDFGLGYKSDYLLYRNFLFEKDFYACSIRPAQVRRRKLQSQHKGSYVRYIVFFRE